MSKFTSNSTMVPNAFIDEVMLHLSDKALRTYLVIVRKTTGWNKEWDSISISQFQQFTGIKDERTIRKGLLELINFGLVKSIQKTGRPSSYSLVFDHEFNAEPPASDAPPTSGAANPPHPVQGTIERNKRKENKEKINKKESSVDDSLSIKELFDFKPQNVADDLWMAFVKSRKKRKATQSARAMTAQLRELALCEQNGIRTTLAIERYLEESWKGLKFEWLSRAGRNNAGNWTFGKETASERNARISQETTRQHEEAVAQALADGFI